MNAALSSWKLRFRNFYDSLSERDQLALIALLLFVAILICYYGILSPASRFHESARVSFQEERELHAWLQAQQRYIQQLDKAPTVARQAGSNSLTLINSSARQFQLAIKRVQPQSNGDLKIWMEELNFGNTLRWLHHLQQQGIGITEINLDQSGPGKVNLRATFSA